MKKIGIAGVGSFVPENRLTNADLEKMVETNDEWIVSRTGIRERRIAPKEMNASDMAVAAARDCIRNTGLTPDLLISSSATAEKACPYQASIVANQLELKNLAGFDINAACSGLITGIAVGASMINTYGNKNVLVTGSEKMSSFTDYTDRSSCILFGDGASAVMVSSEKWEHEIVAVELGLDGSGSNLVKMGDRTGNNMFWQDGQKVFKFAVTKVGEMIDKLMTKIGLNNKKENFYVVPHQANQRIIEAVADRSDISMDHFITNLDRYGNTSSASVGIALTEAWKENRFKTGDYVFLIGFGGGLSWAATAIRW